MCHGSVGRRRRVVEITVDSTRGKCPVIAHMGHSSPRQAIELFMRGHGQRVFMSRPRLLPGSDSSRRVTSNGHRPTSA